LDANLKVRSTIFDESYGFFRSLLEVQRGADGSHLMNQF